MLNKFKLAAQKAGTQVAAFSENAAKEIQEGGNKGLSSFKLEQECTKAAKILQVRLITI